MIFPQVGKIGYRVFGGYKNSFPRLWESTRGTINIDGAYTTRDAWKQILSKLIEEHGHSVRRIERNIGAD